MLYKVLKFTKIALKIVFYFNFYSFKNFKDIKKIITRLQSNIVLNEFTFIPIN